MERLPAADLHYHSWIHVLVDDEALGEPTSKVVATYVPEVLVAGRVGRSVRCALHRGPDTPLGRIDEGVFRRDVLGVLVLLEGALDDGREERDARLPAVASRVFPLRDS